MPITAVDRVKINKYIKENRIGEIYYWEICDIIGKKNKISHPEFLEYFTECVLNELRKETKFSVKNVAKLVKTVDTFLDWCKEGELEVSDETLDKIRSFDEFYHEYLRRTNQELDEGLYNEHIKPLMELIERLYPAKNNESVSKYITQINELENEIKRLKKELNSLEKQLSSSQKTIDQKQQRIEQLSNSLNTANGNAQVNSTKVRELREQRKELEERIAMLEEEITLAVKLNNELLPLKDKVTVLKEELDSYKREVKKYKTNEKKDAELKVKESNLEALIYETLLLENKSITELVDIALEKGIKVDSQHISYLLGRIKKEINLVNGPFTAEPTYKIAQPHIEETNQFNITVHEDAKYYDVMLVSDFHLYEFDTKTLNAFDRLNDYCVANGINMILNLGDMFDGVGSRTLSYEKAIRNYKLIEEAIEKIPYAPNLYHAILGGNHDKNISYYGFDPIEMLSRGRKDIINLGYTHSSIVLNSSDTKIGSFDIHHPDVFDLNNKLDDDGLDTENIEKYLEKIHLRSGIDRSDSYIDFLGHTHKSQFNLLKSYYLITSYLCANKGAVHLRVYFNDDKSIKYMVIMPLTHGLRLSKNNEIVYQKQLNI